MKWTSLAIIALCISPSVWAQHTGMTTLSLRVDPESRLTPSLLTLTFHVSADGASDVTSLTQAVGAWVRAAPGQPIRVTATASGTAPLSALRWSGSASSSTGGGQHAACSSGSFGDGATQDLVSGWGRSGRLACTITFSLADPRSLAAGDYTAVVRLAVR